MPPDLYLDDGLEWLLVELNSNMFQMVQTVQIMARIGELNTNVIKFYNTTKLIKHFIL